MVVHVIPYGYVTFTYDRKSSCHTLINRFMTNRPLRCPMAPGAELGYRVIFYAIVVSNG